MARLYNDINMSEVLFRAIDLSQKGYDFKNEENKLSVTSLISPVKYTLLKIRHDDEILIPVSKCVRSFVGTCTHEGVEKVKLDGLVSEERLEYKFEEFIISGKPDILYLDDSYGLEDNKITSLWKYIYSNGKAVDEWVWQMNLYKWLIKKCLNINVTSLRINGIFYDWTENIFRKFKGAPRSPEYTFECQLWDDIKIEKFLSERVSLYREAQKLPDDLISPCSARDRWRQPKKYKLTRKDGKGKGKTFYNYQQMSKYLYVWQNQKGIEFDTETIDAVDTKCTSWCFANNFCNYYRETYLGE